MPESNETREAVAAHLNRQVLRFAEETEKKNAFLKRQLEHSVALSDEYLTALQAKDSEWMRSKFFERLKVYRKRANDARDFRDKTVQALELCAEVLVMDHGEPPTEANEGYTLPETAILAARAVIDSKDETVE